MKRLTQILVSIVFIITVVTIYLVFDFIISSAASNKHHTRKHSHQDHLQHDHHIVDQIKISKKRSLSNSTYPLKIAGNQTIKHDADNNIKLVHGADKNHTRRVRDLRPAVARAKPAHFLKGKTGVKGNQLARRMKKTTQHNLVVTRNVRSMQRSDNKTVKSD
jgi:hypothetical protein